MRLGIRAPVMLGVVGLVLLLPGTASAHPLGNFTINVYAGIELRPGGVTIDYVVDMAEIPTFQELPAIDADGDGRAATAELAAWARLQASRLVRGIDVRVDDRRIPVEVDGASASLRPGQGGLHTLRLEVVFGGPIPRSGVLTFRDDTFADRIGWREVTASGIEGEAVLRSSVPARSVSDRLLAYPQDLLRSPLRVVSATLDYGPGRSPAAEPDAPGEATGSARPGVEGGAFADLVSERGGWLIALALALAAGSGALHALGPGHGKTLMAAYLVGSDGTIRQAVGIGGAVAAMHSASVLALGLVVLSAQRFLPVERVYGWLGLASGIVALALGAALLRSRLRTRDAHGPHPRVHEHDRPGHEHPHRDPVGAAPLSRRGLVALALAGGILPSPTALVVLLASISIGRLALGFALIGAFSTGLAASLAAVGVVSLRARDAIGRRLPPRVTRLVPLGSAGAILVLGTVLTIRAVVQL